MFATNKSTYLNTVIDPDYIRLLNPSEREEIKNSIYSFVFYNVVYKVNEYNFKDLYSRFKGTYNSPINVLVGAIILKEIFNISIDQLMDSIKYNIGFKYALGLSSLSEKPFCRATYYNFQAALSAYSEVNPDKSNPIDLLWSELTKAQIKQYGVKTDIQRVDSVRLQSNIRKYSRLQLLLECLHRLLRCLEKADRLECEALVSNFTSQTSEHLIYTLTSSEIPQKIIDFGYMANTLIGALKAKYKKNKEFKTFETVFSQHFKIGKDKGFVYVIADKELKGGNIQSPDDTDVTYGSKGAKGDTSYSVSVSETCHPENLVNLVTSGIVVTNAVADSTVCPDQIQEILGVAPDLKELHTDAAYGDGESDKVCDKHKITHVQTAIKGAVPAVELVIGAIYSEPVTLVGGTQKEAEIISYTLACPEQEAVVVLVKTRYRATVDLKICQLCHRRETCSTYSNKGIVSIDKALYLKNKRLRNVRMLPKERRKLRNNVESLMKSVKGMCLNGKLRIRGKIKTARAVCSRLIAINIGRLFRYELSILYNNANIG